MKRYGGRMVFEYHSTYYKIAFRHKSYLWEVYVAVEYGDAKTISCNLFYYPWKQQFVVDDERVKIFDKQRIK